MADIICRWRNGTPQTVVELVNSLPHNTMTNDEFRSFMHDSIWGPDFFRTPYQLACQLGLYYESDDGYYHPRFDHDIDTQEAQEYLEYWMPRYYVPNPYVGRNGFNSIDCPTYMLSELYKYTKNHPNCTYAEAYRAIFHEEANNNNDIVRNYINNFSKVLRFEKNGQLAITDINPNTIFAFMDRNDKKGFFDSFSHNNTQKTPNKTDSSIISYLTALRTKPFMLLAGISGTGKSRIVRKLAQASVTEELQRQYDPKSVAGGFNRWGLHKPANFELIQVKPNWHNSLEVVGYKSNIGGAHYEFTPFVEFVARAWKHQDVAFFLCLDEMNLAPVEQYFAEFLSAIESRSIENGEYETDPIIKPFTEFGEEVCDKMINHLVGKVDASRVVPDSIESKLVERFKTKGLTLPKNLLVMGTVNMDETTFSFSRKVLDRAMSVVMNEVEYDKFFSGESENDVEEMDENTRKLLIDRPIRGLEADDNEAKEVEKYLTSINGKLNDTPFKLGYRAANEALLYVSAARHFNPDADLRTALDEFTMMKILSRIEGDKRSIGSMLEELKEVITIEYPKSNEKLGKMAETLKNKQFVSYWT